MSMSQRGEAEQQQVHAELGTDAENTYYGQADFSFCNIWITYKVFFFYPFSSQEQQEITSLEQDKKGDLIKDNFFRDSV